MIIMDSMHAAIPSLFSIQIGSTVINSHWGWNWSSAIHRACWQLSL